MSISVQQVINEARNLVNRLKDYDISTDQLMTKAQSLNDTVDSMKEYNEDMQILSSVSREKPRSSIILTIQRESKLLKKLENENIELKCALEDHHYAIELIMSKYRQQISNLIKINQDEKSLFSAVSNNSSEIIAQQANKIYELVAIMNKSIELDEESAQKENSLIAQLKLENKGLREMLQIAKNSGSVPVNKQTCDEQVQTDNN